MEMANACGKRFRVYLSKLVVKVKDGTCSDFHRNQHLFYRELKYRNHKMWPNVNVAYSVTFPFCAKINPGVFEKEKNKVDKHLEKKKK